MPAVEKSSLLPPPDALTEINSEQPTHVIHPFIGAGQCTRQIRRRARHNDCGKNTRYPLGLKLRLWETLVICGIPRPNRWTKERTLNADKRDTKNARWRSQAAGQQGKLLLQIDRCDGFRRAGNKPFPLRVRNTARLAFMSDQRICRYDPRYCVVLFAEHG